MKKTNWQKFSFAALALLLLGVSLAVSGCGSTPNGSREFIPGKGWTPN